MARVQVIQSFRSDTQPDWMKICLHSVEQWAALHGYVYAFCDDSLFARVAPDLRRKVGGRTAMLADLARLLWADELLRADAADFVVWLDADSLIIAPEELELNTAADAVFGQEWWPQHDAQGQLRVYRNVHNAFCSFRQNNPVLPFLIYACERLLQRADIDRVPAQFIGPKLLSSLHNRVGFDLDSRFGAISPWFGQTLLAERSGVGALHDLAADQTRPQLFAANLCASLAADIDHVGLVERLLAHGAPL